MSEFSFDNETIIEDIQSQSSNSVSNSKNKGGRLKFTIWKHFIEIKKPNDIHSGAKCNYCNKTWKRGKPIQMENHLARLCTKVPSNIRTETLESIRGKPLPATRKRKLDDKIEQLNDDISIDKSKIARYNFEGFDQEKEEEIDHGTTEFDIDTMLDNADLE
ncbi:15932_t:CDS:2 [Acaulospora morrowiae]|uniref:15932_t:CDS:1 n=1 Tax=Acaulospora morrowiae TaxID=94023 RepID=A0A9N8ZLA3_9GLOM|nr:15932_t:CDS:2 [Acaulospora morrowiae]